MLNSFEYKIMIGDYDGNGRDYRKAKGTTLITRETMERIYGKRD